MSLFSRITVVAALMIAVVPASGAAEPLGSADALDQYVKRPDASFAWRELRTGRIGSVDYAELLMTSQTWRGHEWKHQLFILRPPNMARDARAALLFIHGGRWREEYAAPGPRPELPREAQVFARLARAIGAPIGVLRQVPFQPLYGRTEDALIAYTFDEYLKTGESDWPLLLPMVKSAVRAMDVMQREVQDRWQASIESFTVSGASKRGWTTWLTAAADPRVIAIAPMVIDVLNMREQMEHQRATWGGLSEEIGDYAALELPQRMSTDRGRALLEIVDPYSYRDRLRQPKLILLSTNDRYWPLDALKLYWPGLPPDKHVLYVPNQGHGLADYDRVIASISALHRHAARGESLPDPEWELRHDAREVEITVNAAREVRGALAWGAYSPTRDFRDARWESRECTRRREGYVCRFPRARQGYTASFAEVGFSDRRGADYSLSTTVCILPPVESGETPPDC